MRRFVDLHELGLAPGSGRSEDVVVRVEPLILGGQEYPVGEGFTNASLAISRTASGWALRLRFSAVLSGSCMRCLGAAAPELSVDAREVEQPGDSEEFHSPYVKDSVLDIERWARDALATSVPERILCREGCRGLCDNCGADLNRPENAEHAHAAERDSRFAKLREIQID